MAMTRAANVVVLIPPAVEPGLPPININNMVKSELLFDILLRSTTENPAVLGVVAMKKEERIFSKNGFPRSVWLYSKIKNRIVPPMRRRPVMMMTSFVCRR